MELYQHQQNLLDLNPDKHLIAWETGTGKTLAAIELAKGSTLVVCPKSLKEQWEEQLLKSDVAFHLVTKEEFRRDWDDLLICNCLIIDEAHYFSGQKSAMSKSLIKYIKKHDPKYIYLLTATPYLSTPWNIYTLARILGYNWSYPKFKFNFFSDIRFGNRLISQPKKGIEKQIAHLVNNIGSTVALQDCVDVPEQIFGTESFDLTSEQKKAIKEVKEGETNHIVKWTKIHQISGGTLKGDGYTETKYFRASKMERLKDLCKEHKKVVVVCRYNAEVEMLYEELKASKSPITITGKTKDKNWFIKLANEEDEVVIIINAAMSEGYELPTFDLMVFYSYDFSLKNYVQMKGRIQRINHVKKNVYLSLINKGTIDEDVKNSLDKKVDFDLAIYDKK